MLKEKTARKLLIRKEKGLFRYREALDADSEKEKINFCNNDYLGLVKDTRLLRALCHSAEEYGVGGNGSGLVSGYRKSHENLEKALAEFLQRDRAVVFSSGYMANLSVFGALLDKEDSLFQDKENHASLLDAAKLSSAPMKRYAHQDAQSLKMHLEKNKSALVASNGVFSTTGEIAKLVDLVKVCDEYQATLFVDDAHGIGVLGHRGAGVLEEQQLSQEQVPLLSFALSKAFGGFGGVVSGDETLMEGIVQFARPYCYSTALPPPMVAAMEVALSIIKDEKWRRDKLAENITFFREKVLNLGLCFFPSKTAIQSLVIDDIPFLMTIKEGLYQKGFRVSVLRPPSVSPQNSLLRITLSALHTREDISHLLENISALYNNKDLNSLRAFNHAIIS